ncbi:MAG: tetratricopeptide repeat protein, partial [Isosphaeraceae bacterium]
MPEPRTAPLLVSYYESFLRDQDVDVFRTRVTARYLEGTLTRLARSPDSQTRRAAILALGLVGSFQTNATVARALRDPDPTVRSLAENGLWAIWFRADTSENNAMLEQASLLIARHRYKDALFVTGRLIERAPHFAEAYNQRAIVEYHLGRFDSSAEDCRKAIDRNPYHIGALAGLARCLLHLNQRDKAIEVLRRAARIQPYNDGIRQFIAELEAGEV